MKAAPRTLLAVLAHPDDELLAAGALRAQRTAGDRVVVLYLTRGEATDAFGSLPPEEVAFRRMALAREAADILDVEHRFLDFPDGGVQATPATAVQVARVIAEVRPGAVLTWGRMWSKGMRHPDHHATGEAAANAVTLARIAGQVAPLTPHRGECRIFTYRGVHSTLPTVAVDAGPHLETIRGLADFYRRRIGFGEREWLEARLRTAGEVAGLPHAEVYDAWDSAPGVVDTLLDAPPAPGPAHPSRQGPAAGPTE